LLIGESRELNLQLIPRITHVSNCAQALDLARSQPPLQFDRNELGGGEMNAAQLARRSASLGWMSR